MLKCCRPDYEAGLEDFKERLINYEKVSTIYARMKCYMLSKIILFFELFSLESINIPFAGL